MKPSILLIFSLVLVLSACATQESVRQKVKKMEVGPSESPKRIITNFSEGLRCMDNTLIEYGVKDIGIIVEDIEDRTSKVKAGTKDILITAISTMTKRSRAIKLIAYGSDSGNVIGFLDHIGAQNRYNVIPQYDIRGSISQLDKSVVAEQAGLSLAGDKWGLGGSRSVNASILGLDLSVLSTEDLSVIPGVTSSNSVVLFKKGSGADADATIKKVGMSFDFTVSRSEATTQALRNLIELASIELIGKLLKIPYWQCLDIPETAPEIANEIADWYYAMKNHGELYPFVRNVLIARNYYPEQVRDEEQAFRQSLQRFQQDLGLSAREDIDLISFSALLNGRLNPPNDKVFRDEETLPNVPVRDERSTVASPVVELRSVNGRDHFQDGETLMLQAYSRESAYLYCYLENDRGEVQRFFPNRFIKNNYLEAQTTLDLPGAMPFDIVAEKTKRPEIIHCFSARKNAFSQLDPALKYDDLSIIPNVSIDDIRKGYYRAVGQNNVGETRFEIRLL